MSYVTHVYVKRRLRCIRRHKEYRLRTQSYYKTEKKKDTCCDIKRMPASEFQNLCGMLFILFGMDFKGI